MQQRATWESRYDELLHDFESYSYRVCIIRMARSKLINFLSCLYQVLNFETQNMYVYMAMSMAMCVVYMNVWLFMYV